jgi:hypothetical protein
MRATVFFLVMIVPRLAAASQGPGVAAGTASGIARAAAAAIIIGLGLVALIGIGWYVFNRLPLPDK